MASFKKKIFPNKKIINYLLTWSVTGVYLKILFVPFIVKRSEFMSNVSPELLNFQRNVLENKHKAYIHKIEINKNNNNNEQDIICTKTINQIFSF